MLKADKTFLVILPLCMIPDTHIKLLGGDLEIVSILEKCKNIPIDENIFHQLKNWNFRKNQEIKSKIKELNNRLYNCSSVKVKIVT